MRLEDLKARESSIKDGISKDLYTVEALRKEITRIEDNLILHNGALQECQFWIEQVVALEDLNKDRTDAEYTEPEESK